MNIFRSQCWHIGLVVGCLCFAGCAAKPPVGPQATPLRQPEVAEKQLFDVIRNFYCARHTWPEEWDDVEEFQRTAGDDGGFLGEFQSPAFESPRAIVLSLRYETVEGVGRKVTFIAPPVCGDAAEDGVVSIAGGRVAFRLPDGFELMGGTAIKEFWRGPPFPDAAWKSNDEIVVALRFGDVELLPTEIEDFAATLDEAYESSVPSISWIERSISRRREPKLLQHEFESDSTRGRLVNYVVSTSFDNKLLAITIIGKADQTLAVEKVADRLQRSLRLQ